MGSKNTDLDYFGFNFSQSNFMSYTCSRVFKLFSMHRAKDQLIGEPRCSL